MDPIIEIPVLIPSALSIILLFVSAFFIEKHYTGRPAMVANVVLSWQLLGGMWYELPEEIQLYLNFGLILAVVALVSYVFKKPIPTEIYKISRLLFGGISVILVLTYVFLAL